MFVRNFGMRLFIGPVLRFIYDDKSLFESLRGIRSVEMFALTRAACHVAGAIGLSSLRRLAANGTRLALTTCCCFHSTFIGDSLYLLLEKINDVSISTGNCSNTGTYDGSTVYLQSDSVNEGSEGIFFFRYGRDTKNTGYFLEFTIGSLNGFRCSSSSRKVSWKD